MNIFFKKYFLPKQFNPSFLTHFVKSRPPLMNLDGERFPLAHLDVNKTIYGYDLFKGSGPW